MLKEIDFEKFKTLYQEHIINDFPENERPGLKGFQIRIVEKGEQVFIFEEEGIEKGYIILKTIENYIFVSFLAIFKEQRGSGLGSKLLKELLEKYKEKKRIILEVEDPDFAKDKEEEQLRKRRINFYKRAGFKLIENLEAEVFKVHYKIMIFHPKEQINSKEEIKSIYEKYYNQILKEKYRKNLKIMILGPEKKIMDNG